MITSRDNDTLKLVRKLRTQAPRGDELFAAEGEDLVDAAHAAGIDPVHLLVAGETVDAALLERVSTLPHPARVIGVYRREDLPSGLRDRCLALWRLTDPGNVGTLLRTADAFCACVALSPGCRTLSPKALRASAGAVFRVPLVRWDEVPGRRIALVAHDGAPLDDLELEPPVTFVLGAERAGLPVEQVTDLLQGHDRPAGRRGVAERRSGRRDRVYEASRRRDGTRILVGRPSRQGWRDDRDDLVPRFARRRGDDVHGAAGLREAVPRRRRVPGRDPERGGAALPGVRIRRRRRARRRRPPRLAGLRCVSPHRRGATRDGVTRERASGGDEPLRTTGSSVGNLRDGAGRRRCDRRRDGAGARRSSRAWTT